MLMKQYINKSRKLQFWLRPPSACRPTCVQLGGCPAGGFDTQNSDWVDLQPESAGSETSAGKRCRHWRRENYPQRLKEVNALSRSHLPPPHTCWQTGGSLVICGPQGSLGSCHEWMSLRCWTQRSTVNIMFAVWLVLVASMAAQMQKAISAWSDASNMKAFLPKPQCNPSL